MNDYLSVVIPKVGEVLEDEDNYYSLVTMLTAMPIDLMVQLDSIGVDFTQINEYELFLYLFSSIQQMDTHLIFGDLDLTKFQLGVNEQNGQVLFEDPDTGIRIDRAIHYKIATILRKLHGLERDNRTPGNDEAKSYMLERAKRKMARHANRATDSQLEKYIVSLVNTQEFKYDFEGTKELSIYQFNQSLHQVIHKVDYSNRMIGVYSGTVNASEIPKENLTWIKTK